MKRKEFVKTTSMLMLGGLAAPLISCSNQEKSTEMTIRKNWAGNYQYTAPHYTEPSSVEEIQALLKKPESQKALGSCHCFNDIADSPNSQISTKKLNKLIAIDKENETVTVEAGIRYGDFAEQLHEAGFALHNLASLPHISVAGACTTATHGSGVKNGNLSTSVLAFEMVNAEGELLNFSDEKDGEKFKGLLVHLGALGIVTKLTLKIQKTFDVAQYVFQDLPTSALKTNFDEIMSAGYSVSLFTDWRNDNVSQVWVKQMVEPEMPKLDDEFWGAKAATKNLHPITALSAENCTEQMGVAGPWFNRLPHFKMGFTPSSGDELQSEFFVPRANAIEAYLAVEALSDEIFPHLLISEIRTIAADDLWMSTAYGRESLAIHFTWKPHTKEVMALLPKIEAALAPFGVRPHWGKLFTIDKETLLARYEKASDFLALVKELDPKGKFENKYLSKHVYN